MPLTQWNGELLKRAAERGAKRGTNNAAALIVREAKREAPVGVSGQMRRSINYARAWSDGAKVRTQIGFTGSRDAVSVGMVMEFGRRRGARQPPSDALLLWVERKLRPRAASLKSDLTLGGNRTGKAYRQIKRGRRLNNLIAGIAFVLARSIKRKGIKARRFMRDTMRYQRNRCRQMMVTAIHDEIKAYGDRT